MAEISNTVSFIQNYEKHTHTHKTHTNLKYNYQLLDTGREDSVGLQQPWDYKVQEDGCVAVISRYGQREREGYNALTI
jgi:hypothetical protein